MKNSQEKLSLILKNISKKDAEILMEEMILSAENQYWHMNINLLKYLFEIGIDITKKIQYKGEYLNLFQIGVQRKEAEVIQFAMNHGIFGEGIEKKELPQGMYRSIHSFTEKTHYNSTKVYKEVKIFENKLFLYRMAESNFFLEIDDYLFCKPEQEYFVNQVGNIAYVIGHSIHENFFKFLSCDTVVFAKWNETVPSIIFEKVNNKIIAYECEKNQCIEPFGSLASWVLHRWDVIGGVKTESSRYYINNDEVDCKTNVLNWANLKKEQCA